MPKYGTIKYGSGFKWGWEPIKALFRFLRIPDLLAFLKKPDRISFTPIADTMSFIESEDNLNFTPILDAITFAEKYK